jgi:hypothetical protein
MKEAQALRDITSPDAVILMGAELPDDDVAVFHHDHYSRPNAQPLFLVLTSAQSQRLNGRIHTHGSHIMTGHVSLGSLRREIQATLLESTAANRHDSPTTHSKAGVN